LKRLNIPAGTKWEDVVGYSRAVRINNIIEISGTAAVKDGQVFAKDDAYAQTIFVLKKIEQALKAADAELKDVVRTRIYVTDISRWEQIGRAHGEYFGSIKPATSMVEVRSLIDPQMLVEIEATAVCI
jgi:enamine deaminase RidA (YjgF/YER057c/UK114 family)